MPIACAPTVGRLASKVCIAACDFGALALAHAGEALVELLLAAEQAGARDAAVVEVDVGGVRGAQAVLLDLGALLAALGPGRDDEGGVAARAELAVDRGDHDVDVGDAAVGRPGLLAVDAPTRRWPRRTWRWCGSPRRRSRRRAPRRRRRRPWGRPRCRSTAGSTRPSARGFPARRSRRRRARCP